MQIRNIGVVSPGDMGQAIAGRLKEGGFNVHAALDGRSERTRALARAAGLLDCGSMEKLVATCELVISVINPGEALAVVRAAAAAIKATGRKIAFADLNAVSPQTARDSDRLIRDAGGWFIDGGIIGPPPRGEKDRPRIYVSGPDATLFGQINHSNLQVREQGGIGPRDVNARPVFFSTRRRSDDAAVYEHAAGLADQAIGVARRLRRDGIEIGEGDFAPGSLDRRGGPARDGERFPGVDDRDHQFAGRHQLFHRAAIDETGRAREGLGALAAALKSGMHFEAAFLEASGDRLSHVARADDADIPDLHACSFPGCVV